MNAKTKEAITEHGNNLLAVFPQATEQDPIALCKKVRRIETAAHRKATDYCNGVIGPLEWEAAQESALAKLRKLLNPRDNIPLFVNGDARGYALKIADAWMRAERDRRAWANRDRVPPVVHSQWTPEDWQTWEASRKPLRLPTDFGGYGILAPDLAA